VGCYRAYVHAGADPAHGLELYEHRRRVEERLHRWTRGGQYGFLFDNADDTLSFSRFQTFNFHGWNDAPEVLEPLLFYVLHRASKRSATRRNSPPSRSSCSMKRGFHQNETIRNYVVQAQKTWRKHKAAMILRHNPSKSLRSRDAGDCGRELPH